MFIGTHRSPTVVKLNGEQEEFDLVLDRGSGLLRVNVKMPGSLVANLVSQGWVKQIDWVRFVKPSFLSRLLRRLGEEIPDADRSTHER